MKTYRSGFADLATVLVAAFAMLIAASSGWSRYVAPWLASRPAQIDDWEQYAAGGHRIGPASAPVTLVWWGDYQCPACRAVRPNLEAVREEFDGEVAIVFRHWPLSYHSAAYPAARAAECAGAQGRFGPYDLALYESDITGWDTNPQNFVRLAEAVEVPDLQTFTECVNSVDPVPSIEAGIEDVGRLGGRGTPTIMINDRLLRGGFPTQERLSELIRRAMRG